MATAVPTWSAVALCVVLLIHVTAPSVVGEKMLPRLSESDGSIRQVVSDGDGGRSWELLPKSAKTPDDRCGVCKELVAEAQQRITDPGFVQATTKDVEAHSCGHIIQPALRTKCKGVVEQHMPGLFAVLRESAEAESVCVSSGFCPKPSQEGFPVSTPPKLELGTICLDLAKDALQLLEVDRTSTDITKARHWQITKWFTSPEHICEQVVRRALKDTKECQICQLVILELKLKLRDPATQDKLVDFLMRSCARMPNHEDECRALVEVYMPFILANFETVLNGDIICARMRACR